MKNLKDALLAICWCAAGYLSWLLSIYIFAYAFSPIVARSIKTISRLTNSVFIKSISTMMLMQFTNFLVCFLITALLSCFSKSTFTRLMLFIIGAIVYGVYFQLEGIFYYLNFYEKLPDFVIISELQGLISLVLLTPLMAYWGSKVGEFIATKIRASKQK